MRAIFNFSFCLNNDYSFLSLTDHATKSDEKHGYI
jgi:hypothetical protein